MVHSAPWGVPPQKAEQNTSSLWLRSWVCQRVTEQASSLQGPDLTNNLLGILCRFRQEGTSFMCDIDAMFHQVKVIQEHRDRLRFLWCEDGDTTNSPLEYRINTCLARIPDAQTLHSRELQTRKNMAPQCKLPGMTFTWKTASSLRPLLKKRWSPLVYRIRLSPVCNCCTSRYTVYKKRHTFNSKFHLGFFWIRSTTSPWRKVYPARWGGPLGKKSCSECNP